MENFPKFFFVGRPNVGKSSLMNAVLGYRRSIVYDEPGTTTDFVTEKIAWDNRPLELVDCQGIDLEKEDFSYYKSAQALLFVVDARTGVTPYDRSLAAVLTAIRKPVLLCINKSDVKEKFTENDFSELGFSEAVMVSATHQTNLGSIKEWVLQHRDITEQSLTKADLTITLVGRPNTGKSTLMNRLANEAISRVSPLPFTTRDSLNFERKTPQGLVRIIDTAGIRRPRSKKEDIEQFSIHAATRAIRSSDITFLLIASHEAITDQDVRLLNLLVREGKPTLCLFNFWDRLTGIERKKFLKESDFFHVLRQYHTLPISARSGMNVRKCIPIAFELHRKAERRIKTSDLNQLVKKLITKNPPPIMGSRNFNILYASQVQVNPPTFVFFLNRKGALPQHYQRYLQNSLTKQLDLKGQNVRVLFRSRDRASPVRSWPVAPEKKEGGLIAPTKK